MPGATKAVKVKVDPNEVVTYEHHGVNVKVRRGNRGKHREVCFCYTCKLFNPDFRNLNCPIANELYELCVKHNVVTPVWECPHYQPKEEQ